MDSATATPATDHQRQTIDACKPHALAEYISSMNVDRNDPKNDIVSLELIDPEKSRLYPRNKDAWTLAANQIIKAATG